MSHLMRGRRDSDESGSVPETRDVGSEPPLAHTEAVATPLTARQYRRPNRISDRENYLAVGTDSSRIVHEPPLDRIARQGRFYRA